jgi:hypothetical protein
MAGESTGAERLSCEPCSPNVENHDVGLHPIQIQFYAGYLCEAGGELLRPLMIFG